LAWSQHMVTSWRRAGNSGLTLLLKRKIEHAAKRESHQTRPDFRSERQPEVFCWTRYRLWIPAIMTCFRTGAFILFCHADHEVDLTGLISSFERPDRTSRSSCRMMKASAVTSGLIEFADRILRWPLALASDLLPFYALFISLRLVLFRCTKIRVHIRTIYQVFYAFFSILGFWRSVIDKSLVHKRAAIWSTDSFINTTCGGLSSTPGDLR
jgi:hypothetical protein